MDLHDRRTEYDLSDLSEDKVAKNPFEEFERWYAEAQASDIKEANAMVLATATADGKPSARIVLLKEVSTRGLIFFTNYHSRKGQEIAANPQAQLLFFWDVLQRQVRIEGHLEMIPTEESERYFLSRPEKSQYGAMVSTQSAEIPDRSHLERLMDEVMQGPPKRPEHWGGYVLIPDYWEFWQGRRSRLHDRIYYRRQDEGWQIGRLAP